MTDRNRDTLDWTSANPSDVSLSHWEYHDLIDQLLDDRLSAAGLMKFKRLHSQLAMNAIVIPAVTFPLAFLANRALVGFVDRGMAQTRFHFIGMGIFWPIFMYWGFTRPIPRKMYTDLICDSGQDGTYIRETLRTRKPGLWSKLSHQLFENKFNFPEMNEHVGKEFGWGMVGHRVV